MSSQRNYAIRKILAIICTAHLIQLAYPEQELSDELTVCAENTTENTLQTFWNEASNIDCPKNPYTLIELYKEVRTNPEKGNTKCNLLLSHNIRKSLIEASAIILEQAIISQTLNTSDEVQRLSTKLTELDWRIADAVWERSIDAVYLFVDILELNEALNQLDNFESRVLSTMQLYSKRLRMDEADHARLEIQKPFFIRDIQSNSEFNRLPVDLLISLHKMYDSWPKQLHHLYESLENENQIVGLLNIAHWEFLYVPREIGPNNNQRNPLTWTKYKNETDSDCELFLTYNNHGEISIGNRFDTGIKYLYVDEDDYMPYFWINQGLKPNRWWKMEWYEHGENGDYFTFTNVNTDQVLCANMPYDSDKRYVILRLRPKKGVSPKLDCRWNFKWSL